MTPGIVLVWLDRRPRHRDATQLADATAAGTRRRWPRHLAPAVAVAIGAVLWFPTLLSEATASHSNIGNIWRAATKDTGEAALGKRYGLVVFDRVVSRPPPLGPPASGKALWLVPTDLPFRVALTFALVLLPVVAVLLYGIRRRDRLTLVVVPACWPPTWRPLGSCPSPRSRPAQLCIKHGGCGRWRSCTGAASQCPRSMCSGAGPSGRAGAGEPPSTP